MLSLDAGRGTSPSRGREVGHFVPWAGAWWERTLSGMSDSGSPVGVPDAVAAALQAALDRYDSALASGDETLIARTRLALAQALRQVDWEPPEVVVGQMLRDAALLEQAPDPHRGRAAEAAAAIPRQSRRAVSPVEELQRP